VPHGNSGRVVGSFSTGTPVFIHPLDAAHQIKKKPDFLSVFIVAFSLAMNHVCVFIHVCPDMYSMFVVCCVKHVSYLGMYSVFIASSITITIFKCYSCGSALTAHGSLDL
jgi:hypothetical protein